MKCAVLNLSAMLKKYTEHYCKRCDFGDLMVEVADACTGGEFEGKKRGADHKRYAYIESTAHRVRWALFSRRT